MKANRHADHVVTVAASNRGDGSALAAWWRRSLLKHGLDPASSRRHELLSEGERAANRDRNASLLTAAGPRLDQLFSLVGLTGCGVLLSDERGILLDQRWAQGDAAVFRSWGLTEGANWSEHRQGTNGIGTCLAEGRPVTIHRHEHFLASNTAMSCIDAPIFGPEGAIAGALDVSSARADQTGPMNALIQAQVTATARAIEAALFQAAFPAARVVVAGDAASGAMLLAVDADDLVVGATRAARRAFGLEAVGPVARRPAVDVLADAAPGGFERAERAAIMRALARAGGNVSAAARALGIGRATLYRRMDRLGLGTGRG